MSTLNTTPFLPFIPLPYIEAQYANPRLPVYLKCLLYKQIRIDVAPHILEDRHWLTQIKALIKAHYLNWQQHHSDHLALNGYQLFMSDRRSVRFSVLTPAGSPARSKEPQVVTSGINDGIPAHPTLTVCRGESRYEIC